MAKYINADKLQAKINGISDYLDALSQLELVCDAITEAPTADVREVMESAWIPVSERLPEKNGVYFVTAQFPSVRVVTIMYYSAIYKEFRSSEGNDYCITAWMPMPEPYGGDE